MAKTLKNCDRYYKHGLGLSVFWVLKDARGEGRKIDGES